MKRDLQGEVFDKVFEFADNVHALRPGTAFDFIVMVRPKTAKPETKHWLLASNLETQHDIVDALHEQADMVDDDADNMELR